MLGIVVIAMKVEKMTFLPAAGMVVKLTRDGYHENNNNNTQ